MMTEADRRHQQKEAVVEALAPWHLFLIVLGFMVLFGYRKLPDAARSLGRSLRIFKSELRELTDSSAPPPAVSPGGGELSAPNASAPALSVGELEAQARQAETWAAQLRARAQTAEGRTSV